MEDWYETWFESPLYEVLYADRDDEEAARLIELLVNYLPDQDDLKVLDLGCGRGRHAINLYKNVNSLYKKGFRVTGIDLSARAIAEAKRQAKKDQLEGITFKVQDMRKPLPDKFDAILNLFTTFGYFEEDAENTRVLDSVKQMLQPGGAFVLDYLNAVKVQSELVPAEEGTIRDISYGISRYVSEQAVHKEIAFSGGAIEGQRHYSEHVKLYGLDWFRKQLTDRGFVIDKLYGNYSGDAFDPQSSDRLLMISYLEGE